MMTTTPRNTRISNTTDNELKKFAHELGWFGNLFGSKENAPVYFAGLLAIIALVGAILMSLFAPSGAGQSDTVKGLLAIVIAALSFMGGASGKGSK